MDPVPTPPKATLRPDGRLRKPYAKAALLKLASEGIPITEAVASLGYSEATYTAWRKEDPGWAQNVSRSVRLARTLRTTRRPDPSDPGTIGFSQFSSDYLKADVFPHAQNIVDLLEGRDPAWLHPAMTYLKGEPNLILVNMPPEHGKTITFSINYATYRIATEPNSQILIVSKTATMAMKMLYAIKDRLTGPNFVDLIERYAPTGGFDGDSGKWTQDTIYLNPAIRTSGEKDPTVQALGLGSHIYGARANLIILDDVIDSTNSHDYEKQISWIQTQVLSRLSPDGVLLLVGTRLAAKDLYSEIQRPDIYPDEVSPWTSLTMPAVLEIADDPAHWVTLWPETNIPDITGKQLPLPNGRYEKWSGPRLSIKRGRMMPNLWARVYQQAQVTEDTVFDPEDIRGSTNSSRNVGLIPRGFPGVRPNGMDGLICVAGLDPATAGYTAMVVIGLDVPARKRYVLDVFNKSSCRPDEIRSTIYRLTEKYGIIEWVVETNGFQGFLAQDREVNNFLSSRGALVRPHHTGINKADPNFGVSAMAGLFKGWEKGTNLIELPSGHMSEGVKALSEQLSTWAPDVSQRKRKTDTVMALWMAELACQRRVDLASTYTRSHQTNPFLTRFDRSQQTSLNIGDLETYDRLVHQ